MSRYSLVRTGAAAAVLALFPAFSAVLPAAGAVAQAPGPARASPATKPTPFAVPAASSWVGGKQLIGTGELTHLPAGVPRPPAPKAVSWLVADLDSRQILAARRVHVPLAPASTMKIFTALALAPGLDPKQHYTGQDGDAAIDGTKVGIVPGSTYTVDDLLHGMMMSSGNDCANALATIAGGREAATSKMMQVATHLGAFDTIAHNTSGLDAVGQVSSAYDLALAGSAALQDPQLTAIMKTTVYKFPDVGKSLDTKRKRFETQNHNRLLRNYDGAIGVKNGYTVAARGSFVGAATRQGHTYIAVVMRAEGITWHQAAALMDWAFRYGPRASPVGTLVRPGELPAKTGPAISDGSVLSVATAAPSVIATPGRGRPLSNALPAAGTSLTQPVAATWIGKLWVVVAGLALVAIAWLAGRMRPSARAARAGVTSGRRGYAAYAAQGLPPGFEPEAGLLPRRTAPDRALDWFDQPMPAPADHPPTIEMPLGDPSPRSSGRHHDD